MNSNTINPRKISTLPAAITQVLAALLLALSARFGFLHIGVLGIAVMTAALAIQIRVARSYWYVFVTALCLCICFMVGGIYPLALCLCSVITGIVLSAMIKKKQTKISVSLAMLSLYTVLFVGVFVIIYALAGFELSVSAIAQYFSDIVDEVYEIAVVNLEPVIDQVAKSEGVTAQEYKQLLASSFDYIKVMLPAYFVAIMAVLGYITACIFKFLAKLLDCEIILPDPRWETLPSSVCAWVYIVAYTIYIFTSFSPRIGVFGVAANSIVAIFTPIMLLMGVKWIASKRNHGMMVAIFVAAFIFIGPLALNLLCFFGAHETLRRRDFLKKTETKQ
ncbi:MAG: DUF2232 domain-containing protein [Ruminococcaceae bacterium]|nr:DUF2232 domain-containing protein [Oscillospiraceae bacterium]